MIQNIIPSSLDNDVVECVLSYLKGVGIDDEKWCDADTQAVLSLVRQQESHASFIESIRKIPSKPNQVLCVTGGEGIATFPPNTYNVTTRLIRCLLRCNPSRLSFLCRQANYALLHGELLIWIRTVLSRLGSGSNDARWSTGDFMHNLRDGIVLCQVVCILCPEAQALLPSINVNISSTFHARDNIVIFVEVCQKYLHAEAVHLFDANDLIFGRDDEKVVQTLLWIASRTMPIPALLGEAVRDTEYVDHVNKLVERVLQDLPPSSRLSIEPCDQQGGGCLFAVTHPAHAPAVLVIPVRVLQQYLVAQYMGGWEEFGYFVSRKVLEWDGITWRYTSKRHKASPVMSLTPISSPLEPSLFPSTPSAVQNTTNTMSSWNESSCIHTGGPSTRVPSAPQFQDVTISSSLIIRINMNTDGIIGRGAYGVVHRGLHLLTS
eukprot:PhF_6_TR35998/c0_g1_i2/m.52148